MSTATAIPVDLARELDGLHQLLYMRGGIRPSNAAVDELTKLLLLRIAAEREPDAAVSDFGTLGSALDDIRLGRDESVQLAKAAFQVANRLPSLVARLPDGEVQSVWPADEPLRISRCDVLSEALRILGGIQLGAAGAYDPLGTAFDVFLRGRYEHAGGLGTYLTPEGVVDLMVDVGFELLESSGLKGVGSAFMGDPCCGSGRFLVGLLHEARRRGLDERWLEGGRLLFGADQSASSVAMARVNLMATGVHAPEVLVVDDSITDRCVSQRRGRFSLILTNPPFGDKKYDSPEGIETASACIPALAGSARVDPALAFVARCIELLAPGGVAGIVLPDGVGDGRAMRQLLLERSRLDMPLTLEGVVSLPSVTFAPAGTTAKTSVTFLRKSASESKKHVFLARADHVGFVMSKGSPAPDPDGDDLPVLAAEIRHAVADPATWRPSQQVTRRRLAELANLDASTLDVDAEAARASLKDAGGLEAGTILRCDGKRRTRMTHDLPFVSILHVDELGAVDWHRASIHRPVTPGQLAEPGDLLVSLLNPRKFRAAVVPESTGPIQCSAEFGVYQSDIDPYAALVLLQHPLVRRQIAPLGRGTSSSRRRIDASEVLSLILPPFDDSWASRAGRKAMEHFDSIAAGAEGLRVLYSCPQRSNPQEEPESMTSRRDDGRSVARGQAGSSSDYGTEHLPGFGFQYSTSR
ncbi:MAG: N-6 DNA methylase [Acidimicrobiaceae bacterium]|nr:N-6 DNA methylase [Acidimicrobiaceae bacterium]MCY3608122.1 N-6 DNA methylase [Acidimicrobiaceae bacterium]